MQHYLSKSDQRESSDEKKAIVPIELAQIGNDVIVPIELTQIPNVLFATGWSNHQLIMSRCKTDEQRLFYMLYAGEIAKNSTFYVKILVTTHGVRGAE